MHRLTLQAKLILIGLLSIATVVVFALYIAQNNYNNGREATVRVGSSSFESDARSKAEYKQALTNGVTILNKEKLYTTLDATTITKLENDLKSRLYQNTGKIASVVSIESNLKKTGDGGYTFTLATDIDNTIFVATLDNFGNLKNVEQK